MQRWSAGVGEAAVHLSGGLDSGAVAAWLARAGVRTGCFFLDFGPPYDAERPYAEETAAWLGLPLERVPVSPRRFGVGRMLRDLAADLGEPWGDPVTLPLRLGYQAARVAGLSVVFNGEGGDQLLAGWPNRPMLAGELYAGVESSDDRIERYLRTFHHFYGLEEVAYGPELRTVARDSDLRELVRPFLEEPGLLRLFDRLRWANYWLKGGQNILPRVAALARSSGVAMATPFFDRRLARFALTIPPELLLRGTEEKYLLKLALGEAGLLPPAILSRPKRGMGVPATAWCLGPLRGAVRGLLRRLERRALFQRDYLRSLARGEEVPGEVRGARR
ncbi:MAG TPA: asparagine synthase C-terminal domain-containing protein, partial [Myxococcota bacterium]|nr:asparagine synthase C-terminal domain-containing protein [Myxococcota bacterium]